MPPVTITLDTSKYRAPSDEDLAAAKRYILQRSEVAAALQDSITDMLTEAAIKICTIAYKYNFPGDVFTIDASTEQQREISEVMDSLEEKIFEALEDITINSLTENDDDRGLAGLTSERKDALIAFMLSLGHSNENLQDTLFKYEWRFLYDIEAAIAALKMAERTLTQAITAIRSNIAAIYTMPEVKAAIRKSQEAMADFIRSGGIPHNPDGSPNVQGVPRDGFNAIINTVKITNDIVWNKSQLLDFIAAGAVGYYQLRGSTYPCAICDDAVGLHIGIADETPLMHPHCCCIRIPIYPLSP